ncbi:MAG: choice-of-anchor D domain-containing protein, partial [Treponema sp.]|nr:choice-of-anchor D domain-containing protein [Treponema sp.]
MKKIPGSVVGTLLALSLTLILTIWFSGCEQPANETSSSNTGGPAFTLKNESSYDLTDVTWAGVSFASPGSSDLLKGTASRREVAEDSSGYIYFTRKDTGIRLRTDEAFIGEKSPVTIGNNAVVLEIGNENNRGTLAAIGFLPAIALEYNGVAVAKDDTVSTIETPASASKQIEFVVKNTGSGVLTLSGVAPVGVTAGAFSVTQPSASTIAPGGSLPFKITFTPPAVDTYTTAVTIKSNAPSGDFTFTITGTGVSPKPVISVWYNNAEIPQNGTLNGDSVFLGLTIPVTIRNTGTALLTLDTGSITLIGTDASAFTLLSSPSPNIPVETESSFFIQFSPAKIGTHNAIITIPNNDSSKNPAVFYLQANALPLPAPSNFIAAAQSGIAINLGWDPVDGADGYRVYRSTFDGNYGTPVATVSGGTSWYDTGLSPGTAYYYKAGAYYGPIEGSLSGYVRVVTFIPVSFSDVTPDGSSTVMTTKLTLFFDQDIDGLSADDIT